MRSEAGLWAWIWSMTYFIESPVSTMSSTTMTWRPSSDASTSLSSRTWPLETLLSP